MHVYHDDGMILNPTLVLYVNNYILKILRIPIVIVMPS